MGLLVKINKIYGGNRMIIDSYDINSEPIVKLENFYGEKQHLVKMYGNFFKSNI